MQITIQTHCDTFTLDVNLSDTIAHLKSMLEDRLSMTHYRLLYQGQLLQTGSISDHSIQSGAIIQVCQIEKLKRRRCALKHCTDKVVNIIGDCRYCKSSFCSRHRLPESHTCINLLSCKQAAHERNSIKLLSERCVASKV
ncbi:hypothetical protein BDB01DRAFT_801298 [Pilobolus umbonatus]|nr:hypothetical protein BDB01DRAFT_801298 [Pilobolus umbonatus]